MRFVVRNLEEILETIVDNRGRTCPTETSGFPLIATNCIKTNRLYPVFENVRYVSEETRESWFRAHPQPNDIVFVCKGSPGRVAMVPDPVNFSIAQDMVALRVDRKKVDANYLYYLLQAPAVRNNIQNMHVGTMIPHFKKGDFKHLNLQIHEDLAEQSAIGNALRTLDGKIEANELAISSVRNLMKAEYDSLAPEQLEDQPLTSLAEFVNGRAYTKDASGVGRVVIRIAELNSGLSPSTIYNDIEVPGQNLARPGDILMSWSGSLGVFRWFRDEAIVNQHIFKVIPLDDWPSWTVFLAIEGKLGDFKDIAADKATTMGHIKRRDLDSVVSVPTSDTRRSLRSRMETFWDWSLNLRRENIRLAELRDILLPSLMDGTFAIRAAEDLVGNSV